MEPLKTRGFSAGDMPRKKLKAKKVRKVKRVAVNVPFERLTQCEGCGGEIEPDRLAMRKVRNVYEKEGTEEMTYPLVIVAQKVFGPTSCAACAEEEQPEERDLILHDFDWGDWERTALEPDALAVMFSEEPSPIPGTASPRAQMGGRDLRPRLVPSGYERQRENDRGCRDAGRRDFESPTENKGITGAVRAAAKVSEPVKIRKVNRQAAGSA